MALTAAERQRRYRAKHPYVPVPPEQNFWLRNRNWLEEMLLHGDRSVCWPWPFGTDSNGYGRVRIDHGSFVTDLATHAALILDGSPRPAAPNGNALHSCDNPPCVNPNHLRWGTKGENIDDAERRGRARHPVGEQHGRAKLTADQVREIRSSTEPGPALAKRLGISETQLYRVRNGESWKAL